MTDEEAELADRYQERMCKLCEAHIICGSAMTQHFLCEGHYRDSAIELLIEELDEEYKDLSDTINQMNKEDLQEYGKVEVCDEINGKFHVKITEGFSANMAKTFELMGKINSAVGDRFPIVDKCVTDENLFDYVLKPKSE